eukprot:scaffold20628_cov112-Isochrysis_galbana.AAC.2
MKKECDGSRGPGCDCAEAVRPALCASAFGCEDRPGCRVSKLAVPLPLVQLLVATAGWCRNSVGGPDSWRRAHLCELRSSEEVLGGWKLGYVEGDVVHRRQHLVHRAALRRVPNRHFWNHVVIHHLHTQRLCQHRHLRADVAVADDAEGLATDLAAVLGHLEPAAAVALGRAVHHLPGQRDDLADDQLGHRAGVCVWGVEHRDSRPLAVVEGVVVGADAVAAHAQQALGRIEALLCDRHPAQARTDGRATSRNAATCDGQRAEAAARVWLPAREAMARLF